MSTKKKAVSKDTSKVIKTTKPWMLYDIFDKHQEGLRAEASNLEGLAAVMDLLEELPETEKVAIAKMHIADSIMRGSDSLKWKYAVIYNEVVDAVEVI